jgi:hypothetical protein
MDDATGDSATDNTTIEVDEVLDEILDNTFKAYGSSARDVYEAIFSPVVAKEGLIKAVSAQEYHALRNTVRGLERADAGHPLSMVLRQLKFLQRLDNAAMIEEMNDMPPSSSFAGFLYEGFATKELAARESSPDLALMKTEEGKTRSVRRMWSDHIRRTDRTRHNHVPIQLTKRAVLCFLFHWSSRIGAQRPFRKISC